ncbi:MAG: glycosyltransferase family 4 protein [Actinomycetota bacterium]|nr:glycosyltransferase family 4 protein [Actinomycetota bacterium]
MATILHVSQPVEEGVGRYVATVCAGLQQLGWSVHVASPSRGLWADQDPPLWSFLRGSGVEIHEWKAVRSLGPQLLRETRDLASIVRRIDPALVHLHSAKAGLAGRLVRPVRPIVFQPHAWSFDAATGPLRTAALLWERHAARRTDTVVCVSEAERAAGMLAGLSPTWELIPNGVDPRVWTEADTEERSRCRMSLDIDPDTPVALCVGRPSRQKGHDVLLEAWEIVANRAPSARLFVVGDGPERSALAATAGPSVTFVGNREDVPAWLAAANVTVLPSRWEGMSLAMLEAMARGRSVVTTDVSGAREAIGDVAGAIVPIEDVHGLAAALIARLTNEVLAQKEGRAGRSRIEKTFNTGRVLDQLGALYRRLLSPTNQA